MTTLDMTARRAREANAITVVLALPCGVACAGTVTPGLDQTVTTVLLTLTGLAAALLALRRGVRSVRERVEDRADARTAAAWRARHAPHLLTATAHAATVRLPVATGRGWL